MGWTVENGKAVREQYASIRAATDHPLLVCANHLTLFDSAIVAWALGSAGFYLRDYRSLPWNLPEQQNFGSTALSRLLIYLMKCVPIMRGSDRGDVARVLAKVAWLIRNGETALIFPEGGRSRTGRVDIDSRTYGAGRIFNSIPGCRVLCVYLRGRAQKAWGPLPVRGEHFHVHLEVIEPRTERRGLRASLDISRQILEHLASMERKVFDGLPSRS